MALPVNGSTHLIPAGAQQQSDATAGAAHRQLHMTTALVGKLMHSVASVCPSVSTAGFEPTDR